MAKAIWTQLTEGKFEINHAGNEYLFDLPNYMKSLTEEILADEKKMLAWAREENILHGLLCGGLRDDIIKARAIARKKDKAGDALDISKPEMREQVQRDIEDHKPPVIEKPGSKAKSSGVDVSAIIAGLKALGHDEDMINAALIAMGAKTE